MVDFNTNFPYFSILHWALCRYVSNTVSDCCGMVCSAHSPIDYRSTACFCSTHRLHKDFGAASNTPDAVILMGIHIQAATPSGFGGGLQYLLWLLWRCTRGMVYHGLNTHTSYILFLTAAVALCVGPRIRIEPNTNVSCCSTYRSE